MRFDVTESYSIDLPEGLNEDVDPPVWSYWFNEEGLFLQLSSYKLESGPQLAASERLDQHLSKKGVDT